MTNTLLQIEKLSLSIGSFIEKFVTQNHGFASRTFYAETYALALLKLNNQLTKDTEDILLESYLRKNKNDSEFHHEFNNYALLELDLASNEKKYQQYFLPLRFKNTQCTNWTMLRNVVRLKNNQESKEATLEIINKLKRRQKKSGLILDDPGVNSFQYHCFSASLIYEAYKKTEDVLLKESFLEAVNFIRTFIMPNGDTLFIGRGQEQSFGYGALIFSLVAYYELTQDADVLTDLSLVVKYLSSFQRPEGDFPLVLNQIEREIPEVVNLLDPQFQGWYAYNNFFDYLSFLGFYLKKAHILLAKLPKVEYLEPRANYGYRDSDYRKFTTSKYVAIFARPGGYWSNDQTFPFIYYRKRAQTPCVGGEQFVDSLYDEDQLSFPMLNKKFLNKFSWRKIGRSIWFGNTLWWFSPLGIWKKKILINDEKLIIETAIYSFWKSVDLITLEHKTTNQLNSKTIISNNLSISCDNIMEYYKKGYSAKGITDIYQIKSSKNKLTIETL